MCVPSELAHIVLMELAGFDVLIGLGWCRRQRAVIDCYNRRVIFPTHRFQLAEGPDDRLALLAAEGSTAALIAIDILLYQESEVEPVDVYSDMPPLASYPSLIAHPEAEVDPYAGLPPLAPPPPRPPLQQAAPALSSDPAHSIKMDVAELLRQGRDWWRWRLMLQGRKPPSRQCHGKSSLRWPAMNGSRR